ncbi:MAG: metallo-beta-lactamase superfamily protein [Pseudomonas sp.]|nr:metallo-beta-lactamase superfamily protein [Pseudomonas sp.]
MVFLHPSLRRPLGLLCTLLLCVSTVWAADVAQAPSPLELVVLGSGGPGATGRAGAGYVLLVDGNPRILVDAGPGTFARYGEAKLAIKDLDIVLLTHLHIDHVGELPGMIKARAVSVRSNINFRVFGPAGSSSDTDDDGQPAAHFPSTSHLIDLMFGKDGAFSYLHDFAGTVEFQTTDLSASKFGGDAPRVIVDDNGLIISAVAGHHRDAPSVIYRVDYKGKSVTFSGDIDARGHAALSRIAKGTELLVFNTVVLDPPNSPAVLYTLHTSPADIGKIAGGARASTLLLTHLSPVIDGAKDAVTASIRNNYQGDLKFAVDGLKIRL